MQIVSDNLARNIFPAEERPRFSIVMIYEDCAVAKRGMEVSDFVIRQFGDEWAFHQSLWNFEALSAPALREVVARQAGDADMTIFAIHGDADLSFEVRSWLELWLARRNQADAALVAIVDRPHLDPNAARPLCAELQDVARRGNMAFFLHSRESADTPRTAREEPLDPETTRQPRYGARHSTSSSRWGINE